MDLNGNKIKRKCIEIFKLYEYETEIGIQELQIDHTMELKSEVINTATPGRDSIPNLKLSNKNSSNLLKIVNLWKLFLIIN